MGRFNCDCEREGRDAYRYDRYSWETENRLREARFMGDECDREFARGYRYEEQKAEERQLEQEREERAEHERHQRYLQSVREQEEREIAEAQYYADMEAAEAERLASEQG